jgi:hypothetical protein
LLGHTVEGFACAERLITPYAETFTLKAVGDYMRAWEKGTIEKWAVERASAFAAALALSEKAALSEYALSLKEAGPFPINLASGNSSSGFPLSGSIDTATHPVLAGASADRDFLLAAFSQPIGQVSKAFALATHAAVFRVKAISEAGDDKLGVLDYYLPYYTGQMEQSELTTILLDDAHFKNDFDATFFKVFGSGS